MAWPQAFISRIHRHAHAPAHAHAHAAGHALALPLPSEWGIFEARPKGLSRTLIVCPHCNSTKLFVLSVLCVCVWVCACNAINNTPNAKLANAPKPLLFRRSIVVLPACVSLLRLSARPACPVSCYAHASQPQIVQTSVGMKERERETLDHHQDASCKTCATNRFNFVACSCSCRCRCCCPLPSCFFSSVCARLQ